MKIEVSFAALDDVLRKMGVEELVKGNDSMEWEELDIELAGKGIELVDPGQITVERDGTLSHEGRRILVYIRDQYSRFFGKYKFHVANCEKIQDMKKNERFDKRYVASTRTDGKFVANITDSGKIIEKEKLITMQVCGYCLSHLRSQGYGEKGFSLEKFFESYDKAIAPKPRYTDITAPVDTYSSLQSTFSRICRERAGWRCEKCGISLKGEARKFLHAHHRNGDKSNNSWGNLRALCVECHDKQPGHSLPERDRKAFQDYKRRRGLIE